MICNNYTHELLSWYHNSDIKRLTSKSSDSVLKDLHTVSVTWLPHFSAKISVSVWCWYLMRWPKNLIPEFTSIFCQMWNICYSLVVLHESNQKAKSKWHEGARNFLMGEIMTTAVTIKSDLDVGTSWLHQHGC